MFGKYTPPAGYEIRTIDGTGDAGGRFAKVVPYYLGRPIGEGHYSGIYGYGPAARRARKMIRLHRRYSVDRRRA
ncbi:hypothetical protein [Promicromonospora kroppenstedtii]|uniref:hypothetical protein n=1 Tax=Promicromonospora kroppenstedtii TaxID=440482 RepID=UPI0004B4AA8A|nr:hypothetical protein [Promicromonospora kroppenstedtii]